MRISYWSSDVCSSDLPLWADIVWSMYTWAGLAGALLLLVRSRQAVTAFLICVFAAIVNLAYHQIYPVPAELDKIWPNSIPFVIVALMVGQLWFALRKHRHLVGLGKWLSIRLDF